MARRHREQSEKESVKSADLADEMADVLFLLLFQAKVAKLVTDSGF